MNKIKILSIALVAIAIPLIFSWYFIKNSECTCEAIGCCNQDWGEQLRQEWPGLKEYLE